MAVGSLRARKERALMHRDRWMDNEFTLNRSLRVQTGGGE